MTGEALESSMTGRVAIVTSSGSGIGKATAAALIRRGAHAAGFDLAADQQPRLRIPAIPRDGFPSRWMSPTAGR